MTTTTRLPAIILSTVALALGGGATAALASGPQQERSGAVEEAAGAPAAEPTIDFPLLGEARPVNLIDMELDFPDALEELDGRRVSLIGFMAPFDSLGDMRRCMILPTYVGCKFCVPPRINQVVFVSQGDPDGPRRSFRFIESASRVTGTLRLSFPDSDHEGHRFGFIYSIENAVVEPYRGDAPERPAGHGSTPHAPEPVELAPIEMDELVRQVAEITGRSPLRPIAFERVAPESFGEIVRAEYERAFPASTRADRTRAFSLLGVLPVGSDEVDLVDALTEYERSLRVATTDEAGERIVVLDSVVDDDPYVRLELVGEIAEAVIRQHVRAEAGAAPGDAIDAVSVTVSDDDARRARAALWEGIRRMASHRYAMERGITSAAEPPREFIQDTRVRRRGRIELRLAIESNEFGFWLDLPGAVGGYFVDSMVGERGAFSEVEELLSRPPTTTMEFCRPRWYRDADLWTSDAVPADFVDELIDTPPVLTDVLGIGGLMPMLTQWYSVDAVRELVGGWAGDRWALWTFPEAGSALMLEVRWQDEASAVQFHEAVPDDRLWTALPHREGSTSVRLVRADSPEGMRRLVEAASATAE